jgi:hypothetical protein
MASLHQLRTMLPSDRARRKLPLRPLREFGTLAIGSSNQSCKIVTDHAVTRVTLNERVDKRQGQPY